MIVRILGEGQFEVADDTTDELNELDAILETAVSEGNEETFPGALNALLDRVRALGTAVAADAIMPSDLILPHSESSIEEVRQLMKEDGLIPG